jgi:hypothetical protein
VRAAGGTEPPAVTSDTAATNVEYQRRRMVVSMSGIPSVSATTRAASGPANSARSSARPAGRIPATSSAASSVTRGVKRRATSAGRNGPANGLRAALCAGPSSDSMLGPTTCAVENRGSSTVNVRASRSTRSAASRLVTSQ